MKRITFLASLTVCAVASSLSGCGSIAAPGLSSRATATQHALVKNSSRFDNIAPKHVLTWASIKQSDNISPTLVAPYLDWAAVNVPDANAFSAAGMKTVLYTNPNRTPPDGKMYTQDETTFAHDCVGNRITIVNKAGPVYQMDPRAPNLVQVWSAWVARSIKGNHYDAIFDDSADSVRTNSAVPCAFDQIAWTTASSVMNSRLGQQVIFNGLGTLSDGPTNPAPALGLASTTLGGELEGCYNNVGPAFPMPIRAVWQNYENSELKMAALHKLFVCRGFSATPANTAYNLRIFQYASFLLSYDPATSIISEKYANPSHLEVDPESDLVALNPLIPAPADISGLSTTTYTYGRQYANCYLGGVPIGSCAPVVNADGPKQAHAFPWPGAYHHTLVLNGGGVLDGGTVLTNGPAPTALIAGESAVIAIQ